MQYIEQSVLKFCRWYHKRCMCMLYDNIIMMGYKIDIVIIIMLVHVIGDDKEIFSHFCDNHNGQAYSQYL